MAKKHTEPSARQFVDLILGSLPPQHQFEYGVRNVYRVNEACNVTATLLQDGSWIVHSVTIY